MGSTRAPLQSATKIPTAPTGNASSPPHPTAPPIITELLGLFATGNYSLKSLAAYARERGITLGGRKLYVSALHYILRRKLYMGAFEWNGTTYQGSHTPLTSKETYDCVQRLLDGRNKHPTDAIKRDFPFSGLVKCGHCGLSMVAELKTKKKTKRTYTYYHCTGHLGKCPEPYTRQETLTDHFASTLADIIIPAEILDWLATEISSTDETQGAARAATIKRHETERASIQRRLSTLYEDRLDGSITKTLYDEKAQALQAQHEDLERKLNAARETPLVPLTTALWTWRASPATPARRSATKTTQSNENSSRPSSKQQRGKTANSPPPCSNPSKHSAARTT